MECLSNTYNIYLTEDSTLLFYGTFQNQEQDRTNATITIKNAPNVLIELVELLVTKTQQEIFETCMEWKETNGKCPDFLNAILGYMLWEIKESNANDSRQTA